MSFTVTSYPPLTEHTKHTLRRNGIEIRKFKLGRNQLNFTDVDVADEGKYIISCCNDDGMEGHCTVQLEVVPNNLRLRLPHTGKNILMSQLQSVSAGVETPGEIMTSQQRP